MSLSFRDEQSSPGRDSWQRADGKHRGSRSKHDGQSSTACTCPRRDTSLPGCPYQGLLPRPPPLMPALRLQVPSPSPLHLPARTWVRAACRRRPLPSLLGAWRLSSPCPVAATGCDRCWTLWLDKAVCAVAVAGLCGTCSAIATQPSGGTRHTLQSSPAGCHRQRWKLYTGLEGEGGQRKIVDGSSLAGRHLIRAWPTTVLPLAADVQGAAYGRSTATVTRRRHPAASRRGRVGRRHGSKSVHDQCNAANNFVPRISDSVSMHCCRARSDYGHAFQRSLGRTRRS